MPGEEHRTCVKMTWQKLGQGGDTNTEESGHEEANEANRHS
jgi:hypothetical protein